MLNPHVPICYFRENWRCDCQFIEPRISTRTNKLLNIVILKNLTRWSPKLRKFNILSKYPNIYLPVYPKHIKGTSLLNLQTMNSNRKENKC